MTTTARHLATRRGWRPEIVEKVESLALDGLTATQILYKLDVSQARGLIEVDKLPDLRTIQRWVKALRTVDSSGRWRLSPADGGGARFVLAARAEVLTATEGRISEVTNETASWLLAVHAVAPDLDPLSAHRVSRLYQARTDQGLDTGYIDVWLGLAPWRSEEAAGRYAEAVAAGWIEPAASLLAFVARLIIAAATTTGTYSGESRDLRWVDPLAAVSDELNPP
jgi:hypothetical protein